MRKIKHISDLNEEKMRLRIKQLELERELRLSWNDLKNNLDPKTLLKNKIADITPVSYTHLDVYKRQPHFIFGNEAIPVSFRCSI